MGAETLLLGQGYEPIGKISWEKAVTLFFKNKIEILEEYSDKDIRSVSITIKMPAVVRFLKSFTRRKSKVRFSRQNIYTRDKGRCGYCGIKLKRSEATYDHVIPKSRGGKTNFLNILIACVPCNTKKSNKTPEEVGLKMINKPIQPNYNQFEYRFTFDYKKDVPKEWLSYLGDVLYWHGELESD